MANPPMALVMELKLLELERLERLERLLEFMELEFMEFMEFMELGRMERLERLVEFTERLLRLSVWLFWIVRPMLAGIFWALNSGILLFIGPVGPVGSVVPVVPVVPVGLGARKFAFDVFGLLGFPFISERFKIGRPSLPVGAFWSCF